MSDPREVVRTTPTSPVLIEKETNVPSTMPQPDGYTPNYENQDVQKAVSPATNSTPLPDTSATPVAIQNLPFEDTPPPPKQATDQDKSASKCPSPVAPHRSSGLCRPRQLISMNMRGKYHDQACRPCPTSACDQEVGHSGEGAM